MQLTTAWIPKECLNRETTILSPLVDPLASGLMVDPPVSGKFFSSRAVGLVGTYGWGTILPRTSCRSGQ